jgi:hypothetical protein
VRPVVGAIFLLTATGLTVALVATVSTTAAVVLTIVGLFVAGLSLLPSKGPG